MNKKLFITTILVLSSILYYLYETSTYSMFLLAIVVYFAIIGLMINYIFNKKKMSKSTIDKENSNNSKKILYILPLKSLIYSTAVGIILIVIVYIIEEANPSNSQAQGIGTLIVGMYSIMFVVGITIISFIVSIFKYFKNK